jgi:hypothetical protein
MKYAVEGGSGVTIYIPSFIKIVSAIQKLIEGLNSHRGIHTDSMEFVQAYFGFSKIRKVG